MASTSAIAELLGSPRLLSPPPAKIFSEQLPSFSLQELEGIERLLSSSPHNRELCTQGNTINAIISLLPQFDDKTRRELVLRIVRHLGHHRFTVHNTRFVLAAVAHHLDEAAAAVSPSAAAATKTTSSAAATAAATAALPPVHAALALLQLAGDILLGAPGGPGDMPAFWDMGVGVMGATGFDLPAEKLVALVSKGGFAMSCWVRLEQLLAQPTAIFGVADVLGAGIQLQLARAGANLARVELLVTEPPRATAASRLLGGRFGTGGSSGSANSRSDGAGGELGAVTLGFESEVAVRCGTWHLLTFTCRKASLMSGLLGGASARDEALLCIDGSRAAKAPGFRYPTFTTDRASQGRAAVGAPAHPRAPASALRGQLGQYMVFDGALSAGELETFYELARSGQLLHEQPRLVAAWHPLISDRTGGATTCVAATAEGPWKANARSESISVVEIVRGRDSAGGMLNILLPLLSLRKRLTTAAGNGNGGGEAGDAEGSGDAVLSAALRLIGLLLRGAPRNQAEMSRSEGMMLLGHLLFSAHPSNVGEKSVGALAALAEAARELPDLYRDFLDKVMLRFDAWRRLALPVQAAVLALVNALAASDEMSAHRTGLPQKLLDAGKQSFLKSLAPLGAKPGETLHLQCLSSQALLASDRLACQGALPLLAHALSFGFQCKGAELSAQVATLELLLRLTEQHGALILEPLQAHGGMLALVEALHHRYSPKVALLAARLVCAPLTLVGVPRHLSSAGQWRDWLEAQGLACVRQALCALPADEALLAGIGSMLMRCKEDDLELNPSPSIHTPQLLPAFFAACAKAHLGLQARMLERLSLWLRLHPPNCAALTSTASLWQPHAAAMLASALDAPPSGTTDASLCLTYIIELLCTYALEALTSGDGSGGKGGGGGGGGGGGLFGGSSSRGDADGTWNALDVALVVTHGAGDPSRARDARHMLLSRILASLVHLGPRLANEATTAVPRLLRLCTVVRAHLLHRPPPPLLSLSMHVASPTKVRVELRPGAAFAVAANAANSNEAAAAAAAVVSDSERWRSAPKATAEEDARLLLQLLEAFDALSVRAMMDDVTDAALRHRSTSEPFGGKPLSTLLPDLSSGGGGGAAGNGSGALLQGATNLAGTIAYKLKGLTTPAPPTPSKTAPPQLTSTPSTLVAAAAATSLRATPAAPSADERGAMISPFGGGGGGGGIMTGGGGAPPIGTPMMSEAPTPGGGGGSSSALVAHEERKLSVFDLLLRLLLYLIHAPTSTLPSEEADQIRTMVSQRLRELLWRDSQQGCKWAQLSSSADDDSHWARRQKHVFRVLATLVVPLREHALKVKEGKAQYDAPLAEALVPLLQGTLRTYRHFLAMALAPPDPGDVAAAVLGGLSQGVAALSVNTLRPRYGQLTILAGQLGGVETPVWMSHDTTPEQFVLSALPQWGPLLDAPPLAEAASSINRGMLADEVHATATLELWGEVAMRGWTAAAEEEEFQASAAAAAADGFIARLQRAEAARAAIAETRTTAAAAHAAHVWTQVQRSLLREQAAWESPNSSGGTRFWEHVEVEDVWRRRPLLVPNPNGSDHAKASEVQERSGGSMRRDKSKDKDKGKEKGGTEDEEVQLRRAASLAKQASTKSLGTSAADAEGEEGDEDESEHKENKEGGEKGKAAAKEEDSSTLKDGGAAAGAGGNVAPPPGGAAGGGGDEAWEEATLHQSECELIWRGGIIAGTITLTRNALTFQANAIQVPRDGSTPTAVTSNSAAAAAAAADEGTLPSEGGSGSGAATAGSRMWGVMELKQLQKRRYLLQQTALEIFVGQSAIFLHLHTKRKREALRRGLRRVGVPERLWRQAKAALQEQWHRREISNFEYLMELNTLAGRTFNDLNQYPVFPWVLQDYTSPSIDLNDERVYRDLTKPVGALNPERLEQVVERFNGMDPDDETMPRFHYGSHYSSEGATLFWLLRMEPYTSYAIELQSGRFDHADRLFYSIQEAWSSCNTSLADVKELIPEFYYNPDFLRNASQFELGIRQDEKEVGHVVLPPWADSAEAFITTNRRALESEYASNHLHHWIDLIFGVKQQGAAAEAAANVFFYLTYEGRFDLESVQDAKERDAIISQVACFGQTPPQLFQASHPPRRAALPFIRPVYWGAADIENAQLAVKPPTRPFARVGRNALVAGGLAAGALSRIAMSGDGRLVLVDSNATTFTMRWPPPGSAGRPPPVHAVKHHSSLTLPSSDATKGTCSALLPAADGRGVVLIQGAQIDGGLLVYRSDSGPPLGRIIEHASTITCLGHSAAYLISGAADATVLVWGWREDGRPVAIRALRGHVQPLTAVAVSSELGVATSGASDGVVLLHSVHNAELLRSLRIPGGSAVSHLQIAALHLRLIIGTAASNQLHVYSLSGRKLHTLTTESYVRCTCVSDDGALFAGCASGELRAWSLVGGSQLPRRFVPAGAGVSALSCFESELFCGTQEGDLLAYPLDPHELFGVGTRDASNWARGEDAIVRPTPRSLFATADDDAVNLD